MLFIFRCKRFSFEIAEKYQEIGDKYTLVLLKSSGMPGRVAGDAAGFAVSDNAVVARTFRTMPRQSSWREFRCPWRGISARIVALLVQTHRRAQTCNFTLHSTRGWRRWWNGQLQRCCCCKKVGDAILSAVLYLNQTSTTAKQRRGL